MSSFARLAIGIAICHVVFTIIYNLFFHPLSKYPGPFLCRISAWSSFYHACLGDRHIWSWQQFQIYGNRFRAAPNLLLFNTPEAFNDLFAVKTNVRKSGFYDAWLRNSHDLNTLNCTDVALHAKKRRLLSLAFTEQSLKASGPFMAKHIDRWNEILLQGTTDSEGWTEPKNMSNWCDYLVFDILGDLCFGKSFDTKEPGENKYRQIPHQIATYLKTFYPVTKSPLLNLVLFLKPRGLNALLAWVTPKSIKEYYHFVEDSVVTRYEAERKREADGAPVDHQDMFHFLCKARDPETGQHAFTKENLYPEANLLIVAGSDTTANGLCSALFYIAHYPRVYKKLVKEIRETFTSPNEILQGPTLLIKCKYLRACLDETFRLAPGGPSEMERMVRPGGATICGDLFPQDVVVGVPHWALGRNEEYFGNDANTFRPERWIAEEYGETFSDLKQAEEEVSRIKRGAHPFGKGVGDCLGQKIAMLQLSMALARTLWRMDLRVVPGEHLGEGRPKLGWGRRDRNTYMLRDAYVSVREGPILQFRKRHDFSGRGHGNEAEEGGGEA